MPLNVDRVEPDGTGAEIGLQPGDRILSVNGRPVRDPLEWRYLIADEYVELEVESTEETYVVEIEKDYDDALGIHLSGPGFRKCNNKCVFCFIDQNPRGVRKALRFKDEDFRLSFLYGNYVTLTNTPQSDIDRIIEQRLSPMYISVHATEPELRRSLLRNPRAPEILPIMRQLAEGGIEMHAQIVLMPGLNDGEHLERTVADLAELHPSVGSVCIVPVGLTKHRQKLPELRAFDADGAQEVTAWLSGVQERFLKDFGQRFVFIADEFFLLSGVSVPRPDEYEGFPQVENGVGMVRQFIDAFDEGFDAFVAGQKGRRPITMDLVTATMPAAFLAPMVERINTAVPEVRLKLHTVVNERYGEGITVSGLLCGGDIGDTLEREGRSGAAVLLPPNCINADEVFLDDISLEQMQARMGIPIVVGEYDLLESVECVRDVLEGRGRRRPSSLPIYGAETEAAI